MDHGQGRVRFVERRLIAQVYVAELGAFVVGPDHGRILVTHPNPLDCPRAWNISIAWPMFPGWNQGIW
jgi:hypothetical protein